MHLSMIVPNLMTWDGSRPVIGGLERHTWALVDLARALGYDVDVHQYAATDWRQEVNGVTIRGHGLASISLPAALQEMIHQTDRVLYTSILFEHGLKPGSLVVGHGVWWDSPQIAEAWRRETLKSCQSALEQAALVVSVDYNFLNVMRAIYPGLADRIEVIPNFVDGDVFFPPPARDEAPVRILYPRRLDDSGARGLKPLLHAAGAVMRRHPATELLLAVDRNNPELNQQLDKDLQGLSFSDRVVCRSYSFAEMPEAYRAAHVTAIPTVFSEGTSFSCLEAMASGCAVAATNVGGLTNLIIDGHNGLLVPPRAECLADALHRLVRDPALRRRLGENARATALTFSLRRWRERWAAALMRVYER